MNGLLQSAQAKHHFVIQSQRKSKLKNRSKDPLSSFRFRHFLKFWNSTNHTTHQNVLNEQSRMVAFRFPWIFIVCALEGETRKNSYIATSECSTGSLVGGWKIKHQHGSRVQLQKIRLDTGIRMMRHTAPISKKLKKVKNEARSPQAEHKQHLLWWKALK